MSPLSAQRVNYDLIAHLYDEPSRDHVQNLVQRVARLPKPTKVADALHFADFSEGGSLSASSLLAAGTDVSDLETLPIPVVRYGLSKGHYDAGIFHHRESTSPPPSKDRIPMRAKTLLAATALLSLLAFVPAQQQSRVSPEIIEGSTDGSIRHALAAAE